MWLLGAIVAACGTAVYIELGTVRSSGTFSRRYYGAHSEIAINIGSSKEWRREELPGLHLSTSEVPDALCICGVFGVERTYQPRS